VAAAQRSAAQRVGETEMLTLIVMPITAADSPSEFTAGLYKVGEATGNSLSFTVKPAEGDVEGSTIFQWSSLTVKDNVIHSLVFTNLDTGRVYTKYATGTNSYVWRTVEWPAGEYSVQLRSITLDWMTMDPDTVDFYMHTPFFGDIATSTAATSPVYTYTIANEGPVIDMGSALLTNLGSNNYKFSVNVTDTSGVYSVYLYYSVDNGQTYELALMSQVGSTPMWSTDQFTAVTTSGYITIRIQAEDAFGYRSISEGVIITATTKITKTVTTSTPGFELPAMLLAMAGVAFIVMRRRRD